MQELREKYLKSAELPKFFPIELNLDEESSEGYRYLIFPILNPQIYEDPKIFNMDSLAANLESKFQTKYRTESKQ